MKYFYSVSDFYKRKFGCKVYKLSLDAGCTCPTRDGTKGSGGCIFCSAAGSGDFAASAELSISGQIQEAKKLVRAKNTGGRYIAYFQNFTSTYGDAAELEKKYTEAVSAEDVVGISIATRPDCLDQDILNRIAALCSRTFVSIELGLQTSNEKTARYIHRGYSLPVYDDAVRRIKEANPDIHIVTHIILGLPEETAADMIKTAEHCAGAGTDGIKITVLHILEGTAIADEYLAGRIRCMGMDEYFSILSEIVMHLPENIVIHRLTGDGPRKLLLAPLWTADKKSVLNAMSRYFETHGVYQGKYRGNIVIPETGRSDCQFD